MKRTFVILCAFTFCSAISLGAALPQEDSFSRNFKKFKDVISGVDFFAGSRAELAPFEKPIAEAREKLSAFLDGDLAKGAIVICAKLEQKDSVNEIKVLRMGYRWVLIQLTPEASNQQRLANLKPPPGGQLPPGMLERLQNPSPEMKASAEAAMVSATARRFANAVISMTLAKDKEFRSSRLDDTGRSPLSDWLDIGLAAYASGSANSNLRFLQDRMEEAFPLEDVLGMSRPFVAPGQPEGGMGGPMVGFRPAGGAESGPGAGAPGGAPRSGGEVPPPGEVMVRRGSGPGGGAESVAGAGAPGGAPRSGTEVPPPGEVIVRRGSGPGGGAEPAPGAGIGPQERTPRSGAEAPLPGAVTRGGPTSAGMPKEVQDRMLFDAQAAAFFNYLILKAGVEKGKELVQWDQEGKDPVEFVTRPDVFGPDLEKTEKEWQVWLKSQKAPAPIRIMSGGPRPAGRPE
jgi:hypothetical protein